jgi:hypothetical protein
MNESLQTVAAMKPVRRGGGGLGSRTLLKSVREVVAAAIGVLEKHQPFTSRRETGRRRLSRRRPQCCGRGEAARNCVSAAGAFSTTPTERVPHVLGTRAAAVPEFSLRPGPTGSIGQDHKTRNELKGRRAQGGEQRVRGRRRHRTPNLCRTRARRIHRKEIVTITSEDDQGRLRGARRGFSLAVSPSRGRLRSPTLPHSHTHRRWCSIGGRG